MFLVYINDIAENISSEAQLFADDGLIFKIIDKGSRLNVSSGRLGYSGELV